MTDRLLSAVYHMPSHCHVYLMLILIYFLSAICRLSSVTLPNGCPLISMTNYGMIYMKKKIFMDTLSFLNLRLICMPEITHRSKLQRSVCHPVFSYVDGVKYTLNHVFLTSREFLPARSRSMNWISCVK